MNRSCRNTNLPSHQRCGQSLGARRRVSNSDRAGGHSPAPSTRLFFTVPLDLLDIVPQLGGQFVVLPGDCPG